MADGFQRPYLACPCDAWQDAKQPHLPDITKKALLWPAHTVHKDNITRKMSVPSATTGSRDSARLFTQPKVLVIVATVCCLLWGSSYPAIRIGYVLLGITQNDIPSKLIFAGYRFVRSRLHDRRSRFDPEFDNDLLQCAACPFHLQERQGLATQGTWMPAGIRRRDGRQFWRRSV